MKILLNDTIIGNWKIIKDNGKRKILCVCLLCGCEKEVDRYSLGRSSNSCFRCSAKKFIIGNSAYHRLVRHYKKSAKERNLEFFIDEKQFVNITKSKCFYCNDDPSNIIKEKYDEYIYNGIDRVNNLKGYTIDNVVACCEICNKMKCTKSQEDFLQWVERVYNHSIKGKNNE
jgi:hypothetical protein